jgi:hypothetical protein
MVEKAPITILNMLMNERFQLIDVNLKQRGKYWASLLDHNGAPNKI